MAIPVAAGALAGAAGQLKGALAGAGGILPAGMPMAPGLGLTAVPAAAPSSLAINAPPAAYSGTGGASGTSGGNYGSSGGTAAPAAPSAPAAGAALSGAGGTATGGGAQGDSSGGTQIAQGSFNISPFSSGTLTPTDSTAPFMGGTVYSEGTGGANVGANPPVRRFLSGPEESPGYNPDYDRIAPAAPPQRSAVDMSPVGGLPYSTPGFTGGGMGLQMPGVSATPTQSASSPTPIAAGNIPSGTPFGNDQLYNQPQTSQPLVRQPQTLSAGMPQNPPGSVELDPEGVARLPGASNTVLRQAGTQPSSFDPRFYTPSAQAAVPGGLPYSAPGFLHGGNASQNVMPGVENAGASMTPGRKPGSEQSGSYMERYRIPGTGEQQPTSGLGLPYTAPGGAFASPGAPQEQGNIIPPITMPTVTATSQQGEGLQASAESPGTYHVPGFLERGSTALYDPLTSVQSQPVVPFTSNVPRPRPTAESPYVPVGHGYSPYAPPAIPEPRPAGEPFVGNMPQPRPNAGQIAGYVPRVPVGTGYNPFGAPPGLPRPRPETGINPFVGIGHR